MSTVMKVNEHDQTHGSKDATATLIEYGDYQCPSCGDAQPILTKVMKHYGDKLLFVFRNYPLEQHEFAETAAETALFAAERGKFWEMHDLLFKNQAAFREDLFPKLAGKLGLDEAALRKALKESTYAKAVKTDIASGDKAGVRGTPSFYLNGKAYDGEFSYAGLVAAIG